MDHVVEAARATVRFGMMAALGFALTLSVAARADAGSAAQKKPTVEVFGDRFGAVLASGLTEFDPAVATTPATGDVGGLSSPGYADWLHSLRDRLIRQPKPDVAVMMVGERDYGTLVDGTQRLEPGTPAWANAYGARVDAVAKLFGDARVPLIWVGLPSVRDANVSADYSRIDGLLRDHVAAGGARFVDVWSGFTDEAGRYSPDGPDTDGRPARLRRGIGFTPAGARKLASFVAPDIARLAGRPAATGVDLANLSIERARDFDAALSIDVNAQIRREAARDAAATPGPVPARPVGSPAGPIVPLTTEPSPAGAELAVLPTATGSLSPTSPVAAADAATTPHPGRADDFSWPKP